MKITYKLLWVAAFSALAIAALGAFLYFSIRSFDLALDKNQVVNQISANAFERRLVLDEYLLYQLDRSKQQWLAASNDLAAYLQSHRAQFSSPQEKILVDSLQESNAQSGDIFSQLAAVEESELGEQGGNAVQKEQEIKLTSQLLVKSQDIISGTGKLSIISLQDAAAARRSIIFLLVCFIAGLGFTIATVIALLWRNIARPIVKLREGTKAIAAGDLNYEVNIRNRDEMGDLAASFNDMTRKLRAIDRAKSEFVSLASHQLKTPLTSIGWYSEMLLAGSSGKILKQQREYLEKIARNHRRMVELVNALLNVSRLEMGTLAIKPESLNISEVADEVLEELLPGIKKAKIKVTKRYEDGASVLIADRQMLRIILQNLLSNSVKYAHSKGKISLHIKKQNDNNILIAVADNGCGIPEAQKSEIFKKLFRADNAKMKNTDGSGLGLYLAKAMVDQLGGKIWFESEEDKGTTFYVTLPFKNQG